MNLYDLTSTNEEDRDKVVYYNDKFFTGSADDPLVFSACIAKNGDSKELDIAVGSIGANGFSFTFDLSNEDQRLEALQIVSKLIVGLENLHSVLKKECKNE